MGQSVSSQHMGQNKCTPTCKNSESRWTLDKSFIKMDHRSKCKTLNCRTLEKSDGVGSGENFGDIKGTDFIRIKNFHSKKDTDKRIKSQPEWKKIFAKDI